jgi:hypothetical protein
MLPSGEGSIGTFRDLAAAHPNPLEEEPPRDGLGTRGVRPVRNLTAVAHSGDNWSYPKAFLMDPQPDTSMIKQ